jgi:3-hydroxybutyryl-CoA dehydratase
VPRTIQSGESFTHQRECDSYRPIYYAAASGDFNPIHIDKAVGEQAGLGGAILQGMCTMAWAVESAVNFLGDPGALKRFKTRFSRPVSPGDTLRFQGRVIRVEGRRVEGEIDARNQKREEVLKGTAFEAELSASLPEIR